MSSVLHNEFIYYICDSSVKLLSIVTHRVRSMYEILYYLFIVLELELFLIKKGWSKHSCKLLEVCYTTRASELGCRKFRNEICFIPSCW